MNLVPTGHERTAVGAQKSAAKGASAIEANRRNAGTTGVFMTTARLSSGASANVVTAGFTRRTTHVSASGQFTLSMPPAETRSCAGSLNYRAHPEGRRAMDKRARPAQASTAVGCVVRMLRDGVRVRSDCGAVV